MDNTKGILIGLAVIVIIIGAVVILGNNSTTSSTYSTITSGQTGTSSGVGQQTPVFLTDPPIVPSGTSALVLTYSSVSVHTSGTSAGGWVSGIGSGSVNLLGLLNTTQVISTANTPPNSTVDMIRFNVTSATITINGTTSNVTIPNHIITAHITGDTKVNASSGVLLDLSPTIAAIYTNTSTVFVMVPSVRAIVVGNKNVPGHASVGEKQALNVSEKQALESIKPNISVISSAITVNGNVTDVSVTIRDNSNASVLLRHVSVFGNYSVVVAPNAGFNTTVHIGENGNISESNSESSNNSRDTSVGGTERTNGSIDNGSSHSKLNLTDLQRAGVGISLNVSQVGVDANASADANAESELVSQGIDAQRTRMFNFQIDQNGTLSLPSLNGEAEGQAGGYNMTSGTVATFTFSGKLSFGEGHITITPASGSQYKVVVSGEEGAFASANVQAT